MIRPPPRPPLFPYTTLFRPGPGAPRPGRRRPSHDDPGAGSRDPGAVARSGPPRHADQLERPGPAHTGIGRSDIGVAAATAAGFTLLRARQRTRLRPISPSPGFVGYSPDKRGRVLRQGPRNWRL